MEEKNYDVPGIENSKSQNSSKENTIKHRYPALKTIIGVYNVIKWLIIVATIFTSAYFFVYRVNYLIGVIVIAVGGLLILSLATIAESIKIVIDIEYNTRRVAEK